MERDIDVVVVPTGTANIASVLAGLRRVGTLPRVSADPETVEHSRLLVLPGVGTLSAAMERLQTARLIDPLKRRFVAGRATLAVCLGLQMLCESSEESPGLSGLGVAPGNITRFAEGLTIPQIGWNEIVPVDECDLLERGYAYFANSYRLADAPSGWAAAVSDYGGGFVAAMERGNLLACQFHPELSGQSGLELIRRWVSKGTKERRQPC